MLSLFIMNTREKKHERKRQVRRRKAENEKKINMNLLLFSSRRELCEKETLICIAENLNSIEVKFPLELHSHLKWGGESHGAEKQSP